MRMFRLSQKRSQIFVLLVNVSICASVILAYYLSKITVNPTSFKDYDGDHPLIHPGSKYSSGRAETFPHSGRTLTDSVMLQASPPLQALPNYPVHPVSASRKNSVQSENERTSSWYKYTRMRIESHIFYNYLKNISKNCACVPFRLHTLPYHIRATASSDGRCHHGGCWFSRCGCRQQTTSVIV